MHTEEQDFNERFRNEAAGSSALLGRDSDEEDDPKPAAAAVMLQSGKMDSDMHREMLLQKRNLMMRMRFGD
jgi:hypothetical protein